MPALRDNLEAEPLLTGNGGGQQAGDGDQLGEKRQMAPVINSDLNMSLGSLILALFVYFLLYKTYKNKTEKFREMLSSALMHFGRSRIYGC